MQSRRKLIALKKETRPNKLKRPPTAELRALQYLKTPKNFIPKIENFERVGYKAKTNYLETVRTLDRATDRVNYLTKENQLPSIGFLKEV